MWEDSANLYKELEDNTKAFFKRGGGGGNLTALAATLVYSYLISAIQLIDSPRYVT